MKNYNFYEDDSAVKLFNEIKAEMHDVEVNFIEFQRNSKILQRAMYLDQINNSNGISSVVVHQFFMMYNFERHGSKEFEISQNLSDKFLLTHIKDVKTKMLRLPFKCIQMTLPQNTNVVMYDDETLQCVVPTGTIYLYEDVDHTGQKLLRVHANSKINPDGGNYNVHYKIHLNSEFVSQCVDYSIQDMATFYDKLDKDSYEYKHVRPISAANLEYVRVMFEYIMKCILYITSANSDIIYYDEGERLARQAYSSKPKIREKLLHEAKRAGPARYKVGSKIVIQLRERQFYDNIRTGKWQLDHRIQVRGHYRHQACGVGRSERKLIFIEPFYKGPEYADLVNKNYIAKL